ncbi:MAG: hypothetical protein QW434_09700 [Pyrobaculum sp.]
MSLVSLPGNYDNIEPYFEDARIIRVLVKYIKEKSKSKQKRLLIVTGPRDVGKTLYVWLAAWQASFELSRKLERIESRNSQTENPHGQKSDKNSGELLWVLYPVYLECPQIHQVGSRDLIYGGKRIQLIPVYIVDNAHLCRDSNVLTSLNGVLILIYPSYPVPELRRLRADEVQIVPFRFVEVVEVLRKDVRSLLTQVNHYQAEDRIKNIFDFEKLFEITQKIYENLGSELDRIMHYYLLFGGTAWGIELIAKRLKETYNVNNSISTNIFNSFFDTMLDILEDAEQYGVKPDAVRATLYYIAEKIFEKGLEIEENELHKDILNFAREITTVKLIEDDIRKARKFLRDSHILFEIRRERESGEKTGKGVETTSAKQSEQKGGKSYLKLTFSDPRYALGAYMHYYHYVKETTYIDVIKNIAEKIVENHVELSHYFESIFLSNLALGAYALVVSRDKSKRNLYVDKFVRYVKDDNTEIDAVVTIRQGDKKPIQFLAEFSVSYDRGHVDKCRKIAKNLGKNCIYAVMNYDQVELEDNVLIAPLSAALLLL